MKCLAVSAFLLCVTSECARASVGTCVCLCVRVYCIRLQVNAQEYIGMLPWSERSSSWRGATYVGYRAVSVRSPTSALSNHT